MPPRNLQPAKNNEKAAETTQAKDSKPEAKSMAAMRNDRGKLNEQKNLNNAIELSTHKKNNRSESLTNENDKKSHQKQSGRKIEVSDITEDPRQTEQDERREKPLECVSQGDQSDTKLEQPSNDIPLGGIVTSKEKEELGRGIRVIIQRSPEIDGNIDDTLKRLLECQKHRQVLQMQELGINRRSQELWVRLKRQPGHNPWVNRDPRMSFKMRKWPSKIKGPLRDHQDQIDELIIDEEDINRPVKYKEENPIISIDFSDFSMKPEKPKSSMKLKEMKEYIMMNKILKEEEQRQVLIYLQDQIMSFLTVTNLIQFYQLHKKFDVLRIILVRENYDNLTDMETLLRKSYEEDIWKENNAKAVMSLLNKSPVNQPSNQSTHKLLNKTLHIKEDASFPEFQMADPVKKAKSIKCESEQNKTAGEASDMRINQDLDVNKEKTEELKINESQAINSGIESKENEAGDVK